VPVGYLRVARRVRLVEEKLLVMLATLVQRVTTVSNVQLCVVNRKREGDYADESSNIFDYIPWCRLEGHAKYTNNIVIHWWINR
jgi:hypothetical protein